MRVGRPHRYCLGLALGASLRPLTVSRAGGAPTPLCCLGLALGARLRPSTALSILGGPPRPATTYGEDPHKRAPHRTGCGWHTRKRVSPAQMITPRQGAGPTACQPRPAIATNVVVERVRRRPAAAAEAIHHSRSERAAAAAAPCTAQVVQSKHVCMTQQRGKSH